MSESVSGGRARLVVTVLVVAVTVALTTAARRAPIELSIPQDFADPTVLAVSDVFYAYSMLSRYGRRTVHIPVRRSTRLLVTLLVRFPTILGFLVVGLGHVSWDPAPV